MSKVDLDLALEAISTDLDQQSEEIANLHGTCEAILEFAEGAHKDTREILKLLKETVIPALDRLGEIDDLRGRVVRLDSQVSRLHLIPGGGE